ncbi:MAG: hypothetical protein R2725_07435 [Solirubrobacterales bacterium]
MRSKLRSRTLLAVAVAAGLLIVGAIPAASGSEIATTSDAAGEKYKSSIAKAKQKRKAKLKACAKKAKPKQRASCRKNANKAFAAAKARAKDRRDAERNPSPSGDEGSKETPAEEYHDCVGAGGDPRECKEAAKGEKGSK